jgi:predicted nucleic acid-binding Zn ribbon protein
MLAVCRSNLDATPGVICVLHTWTQTLLFHPHVHCIVTGGGLSLDSQRWIASRHNFLLPVRRLSIVFRAKLLEKIEQRTMAPKTPKRWCVYCKKPMAGPEQVVRYLGRYTHRIAISDRRILKLTSQHVSFSYRNRRAGNRRESLKLPIQDFISRFLLHVVPRRFVRIRYYGLLANAFKANRLAQVRALLGAPAPPQPRADEDWTDTYERVVGHDPLVCPSCGHGRLYLVELIDPHSLRPP